MSSPFGKMPQRSKAAPSLEGWSDFAEEFQDKERTVIAFTEMISRPKQSVHMSREHFFFIYLFLGLRTEPVLQQQPVSCYRGD